VLSNEVSQFYTETFNLQNKKVIISPILQEAERLRKNRTELEDIANEYSIKYNLKGKKVLLFVGRFIHEKAISEFINTIHSILLEQQNLVLVLVGEGDERQTIVNIVRDNQLENRVIIPGRFEGQQLNAWYLCASGFVLPSTYEPFGAVVNESLIFGVTVFCSQYAGSSYLVSEGKGMLFDPLNEKDTTDKIKLFLNNIDVFEVVDLTKRPSLMSNHQIEFTKQWRKLMYE
jgi:glycosyltransferase involved in cell wall biosynthesis